MNYATTYDIGYDTITQRTNAKAIAQTVKRVRKLDAKGKGCKSNPQGQTEIRTTKPIANGFLRHAFLPKLEETEAAQGFEDKAKLERDFYKSLSQLTKHYCIETKKSRDYAYPYNIAIALSDVKEQLKIKNSDYQNIRLVYHEGSSFFAKEIKYDTGVMLYYIPVTPLYMMLKDSRHKHSAQLLLSVCSYLYFIADIPYYRQENCYLFGMYEMIVDWQIENEEEADFAILNEYRKSNYIGDAIEYKIRNSNNLSWFESRLLKFRSKCSFDDECLQVAKKAFNLYKEYPKVPIYSKFSSVVHKDENEVYEISLDKYVSFYASGNGRLSDLLFENVNNELQEYSFIDEPIIYQPLDGRHIEGNNFSFEERLFSLIEELATILNNY